MSPKPHTTNDRDLLAREAGTIRKEAPVRVALGYPAPYGVAVSSLGFQWAYRTMNEHPLVACERFFLGPRGRRSGALTTLERHSPVGSASAVAISVSCETELMGAVRLLRESGLDPLARQRAPRDPIVIAGGPLTFLDPRLLAPLVDVVVVGEGEAALEAFLEALSSRSGKEETLGALTERVPGLWVPALSEASPAAADTPADLLPARAATWSPDAELKDLFLVEAARGCPRGCAFCLLSRRAGLPGRFRPVPIDRILSAIPEGAPGVGLVGAAVTDHPDIEEVVRLVVESGKRASLSSIRADRLTPRLAGYLADGGARTLTLAADGSSQRLRDSVSKGISEKHLVDASTIAASAGMRGVKLYSMVGLPGEEDRDLEEFARTVGLLDRRLKISIAVQAFVPKPGTPMSEEPMADVKVIRRRLEILRKLLRGRARLVPTSARWSWLDWKLSHGGEASALAAIDAEKAGDTYGAWKRAVSRHLGGER